MPRTTPTRITRRSFLCTSAAATAFTSPVIATNSQADLSAKLDDVLRGPILQTQMLTEPVIVESIELLRQGNVYLLRIRSTDQVEAITVPNPARMIEIYPIFLRRIAPFFLKKDARQLEMLLRNSTAVAATTSCRGLRCGLVLRRSKWDFWS